MRCLQGASAHWGRRANPLQGSVGPAVVIPFNFHGEGGNFLPRTAFKRI